MIAMARTRGWPGFGGSGGTCLVSDSIQRRPKAGNPSLDFGNTVGLLVCFPRSQDQPGCSILWFNLLLAPASFFSFLSLFLMRVLLEVFSFRSKRTSWGMAEVRGCLES